MEKERRSLTEIGSALLEHAKGAEFSARGVVGELFPFIVQASKRLSSRAISQYLDEKHGVKVSFVTIGKALRNPRKYWNAYYDQIEHSAWMVGETYQKPLAKFMADPEAYQEMVEAKPVYITDSALPEGERLDTAINDFEEARDILDDKWFCFDEDILREAIIYLFPRLLVKPERSTQEEPEHENP
jgi:hypothetical protein